MGWDDGMGSETIPYNTYSVSFLVFHVLRIPRLEQLLCSNNRILVDLLCRETHREKKKKHSWRKNHDFTTF